MASNFLSKLKVIANTIRGNDKGIASTSTFNETNTTNILSLPAYREHLTDIFDNRTALDSRALLKDLFRTDPDTSAAVNAYLTLADTPFRYLVKNMDDTIDDAGQATVALLLNALTKRIDYSKGYKQVKNIKTVCEELRYMVLLRGGVGAELVLSKELLPLELRQVDMGSIEWFEKAPAQYTPQQRTVTGKLISLDVPNFFTSWFRKDPTSIYTYSPFVSAINTIAARQQVINDLYRIMNITGFPRLHVEVVEEVALKTAPPDVLADQNKRVEYINTVLAAVKTRVQSLRPDAPFITTDSVRPKVMNEKASMALDIEPIIKTLNSQNQAGLKTMATIIGRGESGVNTGTVEARIFSLNAEAINNPVADVLSQALTLALRTTGSESYVECFFDAVEMRPDTELEPQEVMRSTRLLTDLSLGIITDVEYHLKMHNRLPPAGAPLLSGTNFLEASKSVADAAASSKTTDQNSGPQDRAAATKEKSAPARDNNAKANKTK